MKYVLYCLLVILFFQVAACKPDNLYAPNLTKSTVELLIVDYKGRPVKGAAIGATALVNDTSFPYKEIVSDENGKVCFKELGAADYAFYHVSQTLGILPDTLFQTVESGKIYQWSLQLLMRPQPAENGNVVLHVTDKNGAVAPGLNLTLYLVQGSTETEIVKSKSDYQGIVKYYNLAPGKYKVNTGFADQFMEGNVTAGQTSQWALSVNTIPVIQPKTGWSVIYASSFQANYPASNLIDNKNNTWWNSSWTAVPRPTNPHIITIDMGRQTTFSGFVMVESPASWNGAGCKNFDMYISNDNVTWTKAGTFLEKEKYYDNQYHTIPTGRTSARYLKFSSVDQWNTAANITMTFAELGVFDY
ncbi:discoidin domain-containing protein [Chitinophaga qingshengii]|uniref:Discoidin domain-containing protein n=1 Tax=Chitinophaga qingshengii TaxID=1569794 RepID=A0ABR7THJ5_9BACT|nr:discoidin domain-containing protein [Chitinophaga qingshengii]MBC9928993.1 discoidin domain-containing protein [Chitinophaga qingshengii]